MIDRAKLAELRKGLDGPMTLTNIWYRELNLNREMLDTIDRLLRVKEALEWYVSEHERAIRKDHAISLGDVEDCLTDAKEALKSCEEARKE